MKTIAFGRKSHRDRLNPGRSKFRLLAFVSVASVYLVALIQPSTQAICYSCLDLFLLLDDSSSITTTNWNTLLNFACGQVVSNLNISSTGVRVGIIRYGTDAQVIFGLTTYSTASAITSACNAISFIGGSTNLQDALVRALQQFQSDRRTGCSQGLIIISDGRSNDPNASTTQANFVKSFGIKIVGLAVVPSTTSPGFIELQQIATSSEEVTQLWVPDYQSLQSKLNLLLQYSCLYQPLTVESSTTTTTDRILSNISFSSTSSTPRSSVASSSTTISNQVPKNLFSSIYPPFGPIAGGTKITFSFGNWPEHVVRISSVYIGDNLAATIVIVDRENKRFVAVAPPAKEDIIQQPLRITIECEPGPFNLTTEFYFSYRSNPEITSLYPNSFIVSGGTLVNVSGSSLSSISDPMIQVTVAVTRANATENFSNTTTDSCNVANSQGTEMVCRMPPVNLPDDFLDILDSSNQSSETSNQVKTNSSVMEVIGRNGIDRAFVYLGFILDGYKKYDNISNALPGTQVSFYSSPEINSSTTVCEFDPKTDELFLIQVIIGYKEYHFCCLKYKKSYTVLIIGVCVGVGGFLLLLFAAIGIVCCCRKYRKNGADNNLNNTSQQQSMDSVDRFYERSKDVEEKNDGYHRTIELERTVSIST